jgi:hypothetical protein
VKGTEPAVTCGARRQGVPAAPGTVPAPPGTPPQASLPAEAPALPRDTGQR